MSSSHFPRRNDKVNDRRRIPHANGFVVRVLYDDGPNEIIVRYDNGKEVYDYEDFKGTWTDRYGGAFILAGESDNPQTSEQKTWTDFLKTLGSQTKS